MQLAEHRLMHELCRWGPRANPRAALFRDDCGDYWVRIGNITRQFDTLALAFDFGDAE